MFVYPSMLQLDPNVSVNIKLNTQIRRLGTINFIYDADLFRERFIHLTEMQVGESNQTNVEVFGVQMGSSF
jgi:hypothetical protein